MNNRIALLLLFAFIGGYVIVSSLFGAFGKRSKGKPTFEGHREEKRGDASGGEVDPEGKARQVLNVGPFATREEIRNAYLSLSVKYHPDKVLHLGVEFQELAGEKMRSISEAYQLLIRLGR